MCSKTIKGLLAGASGVLIEKIILYDIFNPCFQLTIDKVGEGNLERVFAKENWDEFSKLLSRFDSLKKPWNHALELGRRSTIHELLIPVIFQNQKSSNAECTRYEWVFHFISFNYFSLWFHICTLRTLHSVRWCARVSQSRKYAFISIHLSSSVHALHRDTFIAPR